PTSTSRRSPSRAPSNSSRPPPSPTPPPPGPAAPSFPLAFTTASMIRVYSVPRLFPFLAHFSIDQQRKLGTLCTRSHRLSKCCVTHSQSSSQLRSVPGDNSLSHASSSGVIR